MDLIPGPARPGNRHDDAIPLAMRRTPQWLLWQLVERDGRPDKPPIDYRTGRPGAVTDPAIWLSFDGVLQYVDQYDGYGFAFSPLDEFSGIDLDHCLDEDGEIEPWAERIVDGMQSYTERSPSGRGLHIIVRGKLPPEADRNKVNGLGPEGSGAIEMYDHGRYFTVTGDHWPGTPATVEDRGEELAALYREVFPPRVVVKTNGAVNGHGPAPIPLQPILLPDDVILDRARKAWNGARFRQLYDEGDLTHYQGDWSRADLALCSILAFWTGGDAVAIDRLVRGSLLMRPKWDERRGATTYGERTIARALLGMRSFYDPDYRAKLEAGNGGGGNDEDGDDDPSIHQTDLGNARRLARLHGDDLRFCHPWGKWLAWTGSHWQPEETGRVARYAEDVVTELHAETAALPPDDDHGRKAAARWALNTESEARISAMIALARHQEGIPVVPAEMDAWPWLLNCPNGTLDLRTGRLGPHVRGDHFTKLAGTPFDPDAACPLWDEFLRQILAGDGAMIDFLRRAAGYSLTGDISEHALFFLYGRGQNGKSTFLNTLLHVLGDYGCTINANLLTAKDRGDDHPTGLADLQGRRFISTIEVEDGRRLAESLVKSLTGGDRIRARKMRQDFYEFSPTFKLWLAANHKPTIRGTDEGIWRRIKLVPFTVQISKAARDRALADKLLAEAPGILAWAVRGCLDWQRDGLCEPAAVTAATADYRSESDTYASFFEERTITSPGIRVKAAVIYHAFADWCKATNNPALSANKFGRMLTERGFGSDKSHSTAWRLGIGLLSEQHEDHDGNETPY